MRYVYVIILFLQGWLHAVQTDFDVAIVGTSPGSMLEAIYHIDNGEQVLILEADDRCGGAWKSIDICGIEHVDLGCHLIGSDQRLREFLEVYFGCKFVCLEHFTQEASESHSRCSSGYYFSKGCYELVSKLKDIIDANSNASILHHKLNSIYIDQDSQYIQLFVGDKGYTTKKLIITSMSHFYVENPRYANPVAQPHYFNHLYMLVEEASLPRFSYLAGIAPGMSRVMNLTPFLQMPQENQQLIVVQTHRASDFEKAQQFLEAFIAHGYLTQDAKILALDQYVYDQSYSNTSPISLLGGSMIEILDTSNFPGLNRYIDKWKTTISPLQERDRCESVP